MNATQIQTGYQPVHQEEIAARPMTDAHPTGAGIIYGSVDRAVAKKLAAGWFREAIGALLTVALSVAGLVGILSARLASIAAICLGLGLLFESAGLASCLAKFGEGMRREGQSLEWGGAILAKVLGGTAGILIGLLVLFEVAGPALLPVAALIFGAVFLFTSMISVVAVSQELAGAGAFVLGLLAISGLHPLTLVLVALLGLALMVLFNGVRSGRRIPYPKRQ